MDAMLARHHVFHDRHQVWLGHATLDDDGELGLDGKLTLAPENGFLELVIGPAELVRVVETDCAPSDGLLKCVKF